jgi:hypothetical protein
MFSANFRNSGKAISYAQRVAASRINQRSGGAAGELAASFDQPERPDQRECSNWRTVNGIAITAQLAVCA